MKNIAIIPARSGSKGLKDKNIKLLNEKPLIYYSIIAAQKSNLFDEIMLSTDSRKYADIAISYGASVPFLRSEELSTDSVSSWEVVKDTLQKYEEKGKVFDTVTLLQPTSPLRDYKDIINGYGILREKSANFVVSVCEMDHSPLWSNTLPHDKSMENFIRKDVVQIPRQQIPTYYRIKTNYLLKSKDIYSQKSYAYIMLKKKSVDIDDEFDFKMASMIMNEDIV